MTDGQFTHLNRPIVLLDVVDAAWAAEILPDGGTYTLSFVL